MAYNSRMVILYVVLSLFLSSSASDVFMASAAMEENFLKDDLKRYGNLYTKWELELGRFRDMKSDLYNALQEDRVPPHELENLALDVQAQWNYVKTLEGALVDLENRIVERKKRIANLKLEMKKAQEREAEEDPISGIWEVTINPGEQKGEFRLKLSGVIVAGEYRLEGGWKGSLRGTLVGSTLRLERIDSEKGFMAVFYGRLVQEGEKEHKSFLIKGTWESTQFGLGTPQTGTWTAKRRKP